MHSQFAHCHFLKASLIFNIYLHLFKSQWTIKNCLEHYLQCAMSGSILARSEQRLSWECIPGSWTTRGELSTSTLMSCIRSTVCLWLMANNNCIFSPSDVGYAGFLNTNETPDPNTFFRKAKIVKYLYDIWYYHWIFSDNIKLHEPSYPIIN